ncbi:uncharacterized protein AB675_630 [Cyphellophora attinorum]|uniref:Uncharacterized protein n=1 Tax=Cyphellophora attinorum TaxID=1664694 RepID=A0A0N1HBK9_9EURO|nr:uncharacterized protein AB675_630 [Phialophora attinorum]KPI46097.1 hypothetical protein AB675_630 [Phialophora attinorum]
MLGKVVSDQQEPSLAKHVRRLTLNVDDLLDDLTRAEWQCCPMHASRATSNRLPAADEERVSILQKTLVCRRRWRVDLFSAILDKFAMLEDVDVRVRFPADSALLPESVAQTLEADVVATITDVVFVVLPSKLLTMKSLIIKSCPESTWQRVSRGDLTGLRGSLGSLIAASSLLKLQVEIWIPYADRYAGPYQPETPCPGAHRLNTISFQSLQELHLNFAVRIGDRTIPAQRAPVEQCRALLSSNFQSLRVLSLNGFWFDDQQQLSTFLVRSTPELRSITLGCTTLQRGLWWDFLTSLRDCPHLDRVRLVGPVLRDASSLSWRLTPKEIDPRPLDFGDSVTHKELEDYATRRSEIDPRHRLRPDIERIIVWGAPHEVAL